MSRLRRPHVAPSQPGSRRRPNEPPWAPSPCDPAAPRPGRGGRPAGLLPALPSSPKLPGLQDQESRKDLPSGGSGALVPSRGPRWGPGAAAPPPARACGRTFVANAALPVLGRLAAADELELVGREPLAAVADGGALAALAQFAHVEQRAVGAALHLDARLAVVQQRLEVRGGGREALEGQRVPGQAEVRAGFVQAQMRKLRQRGQVTPLTPGSSVKSRRL
ncbi:PREDICTED: uncharacterized protein LOC103588091 [Galeopterus variegatus]|uniref:Uncharacterized protein LOC103588091 n=1 Tax=Galeopterus variegatus TaxID=482537 RepID=A0ABM0QHS0_GALVR|nr:PREDICTED: uncharacterized protein LOC103588091 [Galeopterus variegatus]